MGINHQMTPHKEYIPATWRSGGGVCGWGGASGEVESEEGVRK